MRRIGSLALLSAAALVVAHGARGGDAATIEPFQGFLVAANATDLFAPEFVFRVGGWSSDWGGRKLVELAPDGKPVKKGDLVARFEFSVEDAKRMVQERIQKRQSEETQGRIEADQQLEALAMELRRKQIDAARAKLDLERAPALSRRQADGLRILDQLAQFNVEAAQQSFTSAQQARASTIHYLERNLAMAREMMDRYEFYRARFTLTAPHDGVVRHAFNPRERRKLQKGDGIQAGMKVLSLAKDDRLAVRFFVPEALAQRVAIGTKLAIVVPTTADELAAVVESVDFFPQEIGFLLENEGLPNGREKAIQMRASIEGAPSTLAAGTEVRVKVAAP